MHFAVSSGHRLKVMQIIIRQLKCHISPSLKKQPIFVLVCPQGVKRIIKVGVNLQLDIVLRAKTGLSDHE